MTRSNGHQFFIFYLLYIICYLLFFIFIYFLYLYLYLYLYVVLIYIYINFLRTSSPINNGPLAPWQLVL